MTNTDRVHLLTTTAANLVMFPNGRIFDANDVFLGAGFLEKITISSIGTADQTLDVQVYDGITLAVEGVFNIQRPVRGGTGATALLDRWKVIANGAANNEQGEPHMLNAPGAQITGLRKVIGANPKRIFLAAGEKNVEILIGQRLPGMVVTFAGGSISNTYGIHYIPHTSGSARRRLFYGKTGTTKLDRGNVTELPV